MSRIGLVFCAIYGTIILVCVAIAQSADGDPKGEFAFMQLPIAPQVAAIQELGLASYFSGASWLSAYVLLGLPVFVLLYGIGWLFSRVLALTSASIRRARLRRSRGLS